MMSGCDHHYFIVFLKMPHFGNNGRNKNLTTTVCGGCVSCGKQKTNHIHIIYYIYHNKGNKASTLLQQQQISPPVVFTLSGLIFYDGGRIRGLVLSALLKKIFVRPTKQQISPKLASR